MRVLSIGTATYSEIGSALRAEVTVQDPEPDEPQPWYRLRQGVAELHRRAEICQSINGRYLDALAVVDTDTTLEELIETMQRPVISQHKRSRALDPFSEPDVSLLEAISRGGRQGKSSKPIAIR